MCVWEERHCSKRSPSPPSDSPRVLTENDALGSRQVTLGVSLKKTCKQTWKRRSLLLPGLFLTFILTSSLSSLTSSSAWAGRTHSECERAFSLSSVNRVANGIAAKLVRAGLDAYAYMVQWKSSAASKGPWLEEGNMLVNGVTREQVKKWMKTVGKSSIGIGLNRLPENRPKLGYLRIGDEFYEFMDIQRSEGATDDVYTASFVDYVLSLRENRKGKYYHFTEVTIPMTAAEMRAIRRFIGARKNGKIKAKFDIPGRKRTYTDSSMERVTERFEAYEAGQEIDPVMGEEWGDLFVESCAAACTSWLNPLWLEHYDRAEELRRIIKKYHLDFTHVDTRYVWHNFRNPQVGAVTLFGIEDSQIGLTDDFIRKNTLHKVRGLAKWGTIPDPKSGGQRYLLRDWLNRTRR